MLKRLALATVRLGLAPPHRLVNRYLEWSRTQAILRRLRVNCVLDVGANRGQYAQSLRRIGYDGHILSFEPIPGVFNTMAQTFKNDRKWQGFNYALGSENTVKAFNVAVDMTTLSSFFAINPRGDVRTEQVEIKRLDAVLDRITGSIPDPRIFLKVDTQGYDLEVIKGAAGCMDRILGLQSEISLQQSYEDAPIYTDVLPVYEKLGFSTMDVFEVIRGDVHQEIMELNWIMVRLDELI